jgi:hypothetical protein
MCNYRIQVSRPIVGGRSHVCCRNGSQQWFNVSLPFATTTPEFIFSKEPDPDSYLHVQTRIKIVLIYVFKA